jgi:hypothetical protein
MLLCHSMLFHSSLCSAVLAQMHAVLVPGEGREGAHLDPARAQLLGGVSLEAADVRSYTTAERGIQHSTARHNTAQHSTARHNTARQKEEYSTAQHQIRAETIEYNRLYYF